VADHSAGVDGVEGPVEEGARLPTFGCQTRRHRQRKRNDRIQDQGRGFAVLGILSRQGKFVTKNNKEIGGYFKRNELKQTYFNCSLKKCDRDKICSFYVESA
jgi:hypothetical protein